MKIQLIKTYDCIETTCGKAIEESIQDAYGMFYYPGFSYVCEKNEKKDGYMSEPINLFDYQYISSCNKNKKIYLLNEVKTQKVKNE